MKFFNGFCLKNEQHLFSGILNDKRGLSIAGFSKGGIEAFEYVLNSKYRIDELVLVSPAFFMDKDDKFREKQLYYYKKNAILYIRNLLKNSLHPLSNTDVGDINIETFEEGIEELEKLLYYTWDIEKLKTVKKRGTDITLYLGAKDRVINPKKAYEHFKPYANIYYIKNAGHLLMQKRSNLHCL